MCDCHFRDSQSESENEESQEEVPATPASAVELHLSQIDGMRGLFRENLILWIIYIISVLFCYAFMHVCLLMPCGHLLGKG